MKKRVVSIEEGIKGELPAGTGKFNILLDGDMSGTKFFSLLINEMHAGIKGVEHSHTVEHAWYILSGHGRIFMEGKVYEVGPGMAIFAPAEVPHKIEVDDREPLKYVVVYAPPGPEKQLKEKGKDAFKKK
jgi:mannose-6-phosphate isomerase-like protein (cupin superfamily)